MKNIIKKLFRKAPEVEIIDFSKLIQHGSKVSVVLADRAFINYRLIARLISWKNCFDEVKFYAGKDQFKFWESLVLPDNYKFYLLEELKSVDQEFVINFSDSAEVLNILDSKLNCAISDIDNRYNLLFEPLLDSEILHLKKLESFWPNEEFNEIKLDNQIVSEDLINAIVLDIGNNTNNKKCLNLIDNIKKNYKYEIYLIGPEFDTAELVSLKKYPMQNISEKYQIAIAGLVYITDDADSAQLFTRFGLDLIYIGKQKLEGVRTIDPMDNFELKSTIPEIIKRG